MSGKGGGGGGGGGKGSNGISSIPAGSRKVVQSLKEIVNCPEAEIYATLKECNMDPNEAVNRLLTQDPFREVKSKREKKKETKDTTELRPRGTNNVTHRGGRGASDRYGRAGSSHFGSSESGAMRGKPAAYKKENGAHAYAGSTSYASATAGNQGARQAPFTSDSLSAENKTPTVTVGDAAPSSVQPSSGFQSAWIGAPGQVSMADIVKMGRPQVKATLPNHTANEQHDEWAPLPSVHNAHKVPEVYNEAEVSANQHAYSNNEWPSYEQPSGANVSSFDDAPSAPELYANPSSLALDLENEHVRSEIDDAQSDEDDLDETLNESQVGPPSVSNRHMQDDGTGGSSLFDNELYENIGSYQSHSHAFENNEAEESSSVAANLQQLSLQNDDKVVPPEDESPVVIIPNHLQVHAQDCAHLSFGSFGSVRNAGLSEPFASRSLDNNSEETSEPVEAPSTAHSDARDADYYVDEHRRISAEDNLVNRTSLNTGNYDPPSAPQPQVLKEETEEAGQENQYAFATSAPGYNYENSQHLDATFNNQQPSSQMQNIAAFSSVMQAYSNALPSALLASNMPTGREPELPYSPFSATQSMPTKYGTSATSISGPSISMPEALRASSISTQQAQQQSLGGAGVATGPALPQHLPVHPYSQPTLPLGHYANMISYPFLPQSYAYMPSAFQQAFAGNNTYHQSLSAVLPQYKNNVSASSLPQSAAVPPGYGFGNSTSIPAGNFAVNTPAAPAGTTLSYDDMLSSQYKDNSHLMSLQQNENSAMWLQGHGSRTMSAVPANSYYNFQGQHNQQQQQQQQQQQPSGFRQGQQQQPSQHFGGPLGYPNYYHSQAGISMDHQQQQQQQQQNARDGSHVSQQGQGLKQNQELWQNSY